MSSSVSTSGISSSSKYEWVPYVIWGLLFIASVTILLYLVLKKKPCTPNCSGKCDGDDSCGGTCPNNCPSNQQCINGVCSGGDLCGGICNSDEFCGNNGKCYSIPPDDPCFTRCVDKNCLCPKGFTCGADGKCTNIPDPCKGGCNSTTCPCKNGLVCKPDGSCKPPPVDPCEGHCNSTTCPCKNGLVCQPDGSCKPPPVGKTCQSLCTDQDKGHGCIRSCDLNQTFTCFDPKNQVCTGTNKEADCESAGHIWCTNKP